MAENLNNINCTFILNITKKSQGSDAKIINSKIKNYFEAFNVLEYE